MTKTRAFLLLLALASLISGQNYRVDWSVLSLGGTTMRSNYLTATPSVGQTAVGRISSPSFLAMVGFWHSDWSVGIRQEPDLGQSIAPPTRLEDPAPNPFRHSTRVSYSLAGEKSVLLQVYDPVGRVVKTLASGSQKPGRYELRWDGTDELGQALANGIYFCVLETGELRSTAKLLLAR